MRPARTVLDIGCAFRPQPFVEAAIHICCEPCEPHLDRLIVETSAATKVVCVQCNLEHASKMFPASSAGSMFTVDVIEQVNRQVGLDSLRRLQRITQQQVPLFTPIGFMPQEVDSQNDSWVWALASGRGTALAGASKTSRRNKVGR